MKKIADSISKGIKLIRDFAAKNGPMLPQHSNIASTAVAKLLPKVPVDTYVRNTGKALISRLLPTAQSAAAQGQPFTGEGLVRLARIFRGMKPDAQQRVLKSLFGKFVGSADDITGSMSPVKDGLIREGRGYLDTTRTLRAGSDRFGLVKKLLAIDKYLPSGRLPDIVEDTRVLPLAYGGERIGGTVYRGGMPAAGRVGSQGATEHLGDALAKAIYHRDTTIASRLFDELRGARPMQGKLRPARIGHRQVRPLVSDLTPLASDLTPLASDLTKL